MVSLSSCTLLLSKLCEALTVNCEALLFADLLCEVYREAVCIRELECIITGENCLALCLECVCETVEELCTLVDSLCESLFLNTDYLLDIVALLVEFRICALVLVDNCVAYLAEERSCYA